MPCTTARALSGGQPADSLPNASRTRARPASLPRSSPPVFPGARRPIPALRPCSARRPAPGGIRRRRDGRLARRAEPRGEGAPKALPALPAGDRPRSRVRGVCPAAPALRARSAILRGSRRARGAGGAGRRGAFGPDRRADPRDRGGAGRGQSAGRPRRGMGRPLPRAEAGISRRGGPGRGARAGDAGGRGRGAGVRVRRGMPRRGRLRPPARGAGPSCLWR